MEPWLAKLMSSHDQAIAHAKDVLINWMAYHPAESKRFVDMLCECEDAEVIRGLSDTEILEVKSLAKLAISYLLVEMGAQLSEEEGA